MQGTSNPIKIDGFFVVAKSDEKKLDNFGRRRVRNWVVRARAHTRAYVFDLRARGFRLHTTVGHGEGRGAGVPLGT